MKNKKLNGYDLSRRWFDFCFENPEKISPNHTALYFFAVENCNRLGWVEKFGLPTEMAKAAIGIKSYHTYIRTFNDLVEWGFFQLIQRSKNQYTSNIIALTKIAKANDKATIKALDKALANHVSEQPQSTCKSNDSINKQVNNETNKHTEQETSNKETVFSFEEFWEMYPIKVNKKKAREKYEKISETNRQKIKDTIQDFINHKQFPGYSHPHAITYLNQERWNDDIKTSSLKDNFTEKQLLGRWADARKHYDNNTAEITILKPEDAEMFERLKETYTEKDFDQAMVGFFSQESKYPQMRIQPSHFLKNFEMYLHLFRSGGKLYGGTKDKTKFGML